METLIRSIEEAGRKEIDRIRKDTDAQIREIRKKFEEEAIGQAKKILDNAKSEAHLAKERILSNAKIEAREMADKKKNALIDNVFEKAKEMILSSGEAEKKKLLISLEEEGKRDIKNPEVFVDKKYANLIRSAKTMNLGDFGVLIKSRDGKETVTNTLTEKTEHIKTTMRHEVAKVLFE